MSVIIVLAMSPASRSQHEGSRDVLSPDRQALLTAAKRFCPLVHIIIIITTDKTTGHCHSKALLLSKHHRFLLLMHSHP